MNTHSGAPQLLLGGSLLFFTICAQAASGTSPASAPGSCTATSNAALEACQFDAESEYRTTRGKCRNFLNAETRQDCTDEAAETRQESRQDCSDQLEARLQVCSSLGESRYDPLIDPALFVDPRQIGKSVAPNPYLMLIPGRTMVYRNGDEHIETAVTKQTETILGVRCAVIHDVSTEDGEVTEDTIDWLAQDVYGNIWYFGEISQAFEDGVIESLEGSWKAGVDFDKPGIVMKAAPAVGEVYRQEFSLGNAEDIGKVVSLTSSAHTPGASCSGNCLQTHDYTPMEPDVLERKYYSPGIGLLLTIEPGAREELIEVRQ